MKKLAYIIIILSIVSCNMPTTVGSPYALTTSEYEDIAFVFGKSFADEVKDKFYWGKFQDTAVGKYTWGSRTILMSDAHTQNDHVYNNVAVHEAMHYWQDVKLNMEYYPGKKYTFTQEDMVRNNLETEQTAVLVQYLAYHRAVPWSGRIVYFGGNKMLLTRELWNLCKAVLDKNKIVGYSVPRF